MKYILEIFHRGECIEQWEYDAPLIPPDKGDRIFIEFQNPVYGEEYGYWWVVHERKHFLFTSARMQTLRLVCAPDPAEGA